MNKGRNKLLEFLLDKQSKGLEMNLGEAMSKCDIRVEGDGMSSWMNMFREHWEENNLKK
tara:strand:- start:242 stop:418 length:177 start_codon:yes stop_codon:yes gene_type:complete